MSAEPAQSHESLDSIEVNMSRARTHLPDYVEQVKQGQVLYLTNRGKPLGVALVPSEVAERHQELEDAYWAQRAAEAEASGTVTWDEAILALEGGDT